jgi:hypothetical protein
MVGRGRRFTIETAHTRARKPTWKPAAELAEQAAKLHVDVPSLPRPAMPMRLSLAGPIVLLVAVCTPAFAFAQGGPRISSVSWLTGCLELRAANRLVEEQRMSERGGTMLGMGRTIGERGLADYELTLIKQEGDRLLFEAHPHGQPAATFAARVATADSVVFEAPEHDFPQRVGYRRLGADSVLAWVEGTMNGKTRRIEFPYRRVQCATTP